VRTLELQQGSAEWDAHRRAHKNSSEAPAMMGASSKVPRSELLRLRATGNEREFSRFVTEVLFPNGHAVEALARPFIEEFIGEDLFPVVGVSDEFPQLSASFDGITMGESIVWECKQWNEAKAASVRRGEIPAEDLWQCVQQLVVSRAEKLLYTVTDGTPDNTVSMWLMPDPIQEAKLIAAWKQFDVDLAAYEPQPIKSATVAAPVEGFGALTMRVEGRVLACNLDAFRSGAEAFIARLPKPAELQTDQDFADADAAVKACTEAETRIMAAKDAALAQMADVDAVLRAADIIAETIRAARLALNKVVEAEKQNRKAEIVRAGADAVRPPYVGINATLKGYELGVPASVLSDLGSAIKGLKTVASIRDKIDGAVAQAKIAASQEADRRRLSIAVLEQNAEHRALIPDAAALVASKSADDLRNLIAARVAEHDAKVRRQAEEEAERERQRIREEERRKLEHESRADTASAPAVATAAAPSTAGGAPAPARLVPPSSVSAAPAAASARIKLGDLNAIIAPLSISADGLAQLGFQSVATERAAKLYAASDVPKIIAALIDRLQRSASMRRAA
jgi:predicted phage-related endonuclease